MAIKHQQTMTVEEYFQLEENDPDTRYEYIDGHVYAMAGGTANHDTIKSNIQRILWNLLRGSECRVYSSDMKVYISETRYFHPDVIVTCDPRDRGTIQAIQSPRLVVEVLSPTTELTDRTWKLKNYRTHPTIEEHVLAAGPPHTSHGIIDKLFLASTWIVFPFISTSCSKITFTVNSVVEPKSYS